MSKGEHTRQIIIEQAAQVFNLRGFYGASMEDVLQATKLTKGGIYNHFVSKEALAVEAFDYAVSLYQERFRELFTGKRDTRERLLAFIYLFRGVVDNPILRGGCPVLNTAVESDSNNPALRERAQQACDDWRQFIVRTVTRGEELGTVRTGTDPEAVASIMISTVEGAMMLTKLFDSNSHMYRATDHLAIYIESFLQEKPE
jgi:TetR/AcrR family transcriptional regulator, transcriptional repressor for nem operon